LLQRKQNLRAIVFWRRSDLKIALRPVCHRGSVKAPCEQVYMVVCLVWFG